MFSFVGGGLGGRTHYQDGAARQFSTSSRKKVHPVVDQGPRWHQVGHLAVVQGGLTTCMELTACGTPFIYVPLRRHFEQNLHVRHRLDRHRAGRHLAYEEASDPDLLAAAIAAEVRRTVDYLPVSTDGAARAARLLGDLL
ncbi:MAG: glycosyltransferase [Nakamurella sp.]